MEGGTFSGNKTDEDGGVIYSDGQLTVSHATLADNLAPHGGAIDNQDDASIYGSSFTWNKAHAPPSARSRAASASRHAATG